MRLSMTYDHGCEMAQHALMSARLKMHIYFADPHSPWQRGSNENINGLTRQYLPKGTDLSGVSQIRLNDIACLLNTRARKRLGWDSPQDRSLADIEYLKMVLLLHVEFTVTLNPKAIQRWARYFSENGPLNHFYDPDNPRKHKRLPLY